MASKEAPHGLAPVKAKALDISPLFRKGEVPSVSTESEDKSKWISQISEKYKNDLEIAAPDLKSEGLSGHYANTLLKKLGKDASSINELVETGKKEFYQLGKHVYGPLAVSFVDDVLKNAGEDDIIMFPARDATPFYEVAKALKEANPEAYKVKLSNLQNPVLNRKIWGVEDEQESENGVLGLKSGLVEKYMHQIGFGSGKNIIIAEVGAWGTMIDALKKDKAEEKYSVYFFFTHMPDKIFGYLNNHAAKKSIPEESLEIIADTWEAFPKYYKRPTEPLVDGGEKVYFVGKMIESPFLKEWTMAALEGVKDAAKEFAHGALMIDPCEEIKKMLSLSEQAKEDFTGVLPWHSETWTQGDEWKKNWKWGKIAPLS